MQRSRKGASPRISQGASEATSAGGLLVAECLDASAVLDGSGAGHGNRPRARTTLVCLSVAPLSHALVACHEDAAVARIAAAHSSRSSAAR